MMMRAETLLKLNGKNKARLDSEGISRCQIFN
jgi:hypothetical protein